MRPRAVGSILGVPGDFWLDAASRFTHCHRWRRFHRVRLADPYSIFGYTADIYMLTHGQPKPGTARDEGAWQNGAAPCVFGISLDIVAQLCG